jgi:hypothetical protein
MAASEETKGIGLAVPLASALVALSFLLFTVFQTIEQVHNQATLSKVKTSQETSVKQGQTLRQQLQTIAGQTAQLADAGNAGARKVVEEMAKQGIGLKAPQAQSGEPKSTSQAPAPSGKR